MMVHQPAVHNSLFLQTFGVPALLRFEGGGPARAIQIRRKDLALLIYLFIERKRTHGRRHLASLLWGDASEDNARHSLTQALARLRNLVGSDVVVLTPDDVEWRGGLRSDVAAITSDQDERIHELPTAAFLAEFVVGRGGAEFEIWAEGKRSYYRLMLLRLLEQVGQEAEEKGAWEDALSAGLRATEVDPIHEEGHRRVMRAWSAMGERGLALLHFRSFRQWVWDELEDEPEAATCALAEQLLDFADGSSPDRTDAHRRVVPPGRRPNAVRWASAQGIRSVSSPALRGDAWVRSSWSRRARFAFSIFIGVGLLVATPLIPFRWLDADEVGIVPGDGQPLVAAGEKMPLVAFGGSFRRYPDWETFLACSSWQPGIAIRLDRLPIDANVKDLPSVLDHPWVAGYALVQSDVDPTAVYAIVGCTKSPVPSNSQARQSRPGPIHVVADSILVKLPMGASLHTPVRPAGSVIRLEGQSDMRWVLFGGGALVVPSRRELASHCRATVSEVDSAEFAAYRVVGRLRTSRLPCGPAQIPR